MTESVRRSLKGCQRGDVGWLFFFLLVVASAAVFGFAVGVSSQETDTQTDVCKRKGGVPVQNQGRIVCYAKSVVIEVR